MLTEDLVFFKVSGLPLSLLTMLHKAEDDDQLMQMEAHLRAFSNFFVMMSKYPLMHIAAAAPFENVVKIMLAKNFFYSFTEQDDKTPLAYRSHGNGSDQERHCAADEHSYQNSRVR